MTPARQFLDNVIEPALFDLSQIVGRPLDDERAACLLLAICMQESGLEHRRQIGDDGRPLTRLARGWAQFESGGGVKGVMTHAASKDYAAKLCEALHVPFDQATIHEAIAWNDTLAVGFARLLLWTDPAPLPAVGDQDGAWDYYVRNWRPGKPHHLRWIDVYPQAVAALNATPITLATTTPEQPAVNMSAEEARIARIVESVMLSKAAKDAEPEPAAAPAPAAPATPPGQLTVEGGARDPITVNLPTMNPLSGTGEYRLTLMLSALFVAIKVAALFFPALAPLAEDPTLLALPGTALGAFASRQFYKGQRVNAAASVAKAEVKA